MMPLGLIIFLLVGQVQLAIGFNHIPARWSGTALVGLHDNAIVLGFIYILQILLMGT